MKINKKIVALVTVPLLVVATIGVVAMNNNSDNSEQTTTADKDRVVEIQKTESKDPETGQVSSTEQVVVEEEPLKQPESKQETEGEKPAPINVKDYASSKLSLTLPDKDNDKYMAWSMPCLEEIVEIIVGWDKATTKDIDTIFTKLNKYGSVCAAARVVKATKEL